MSSPTQGVDLLADRLHTTAIHILRRVRQEDVDSGVTPARLSALSVVVFAGPLKLGDLAALEQVRPATMSRTVDALQEGGLVTKEVDPDDARAVLIEATPDGTRLLHDARRRRVHALAQGLEGLDAEELVALRRALVGLSRTLAIPVRDPAD